MWHVLNTGGEDALENALRRFDAKLTWLSIQIGEGKVVRLFFGFVEADDTDFLWTVETTGCKEVTQ